MSATKLLLLEDVEDLGKSGEIVSVKPGFARNYLLPQQLALVADKRALRLQEQLQEKRRLKSIEEKSESNEIAKALETVVLTMVVKVDPQGHMFGSVSMNDIRSALEKKHNIIVGKKAVQLPHPLKQTGVHTVPLKLKEEVEAAVQVKIISEDDFEKETEQS